MTKSFVVLEHKTDPHHFDLMLEREEVLWTWAYYEPEFPETFQELELERIQDHRKKYLTYEGPISRNRGHVQQMEKGSYEMSMNGSAQLEGSFYGNYWNGPFRLQKTERKGPRNNPLWLLKTNEEPGS